MSIEFKLPELGENIASADVVRVLVREGDVIAANDGILELETEKAVIELPCPLAGKVVKVHVSKGQTVKVGQLLLTLESAAAKQPAPAPEAGAPSQAETPPAVQTPAPVAETPAAKPTSSTSPLPAGPETRRLARELNVDLTQISGSGKRGRITPEDVRAAVSGAPAAPVGQPPRLEGLEPAVPPGELGQDTYGPVRRERMSRIRKTIAAQMVKSATIIPHVTNFDDADVTDLEHIRKTVPQAYLGPSIKLTAMAFVMKAVALALRQHPLLNCSLDDEKEEIVYKQYVNIGVAVDTPRGLVVPVIRNTDQLGVLQIARELTVLAARARAAEFKLEELRGGTFTISNLGAVGGAYSTPIINHPEAAILLLGRTRPVLGVHDGKVESRLMMPLSLSFDHRVVDGAAGGRFLNSVIDFLQTPGKLLLTG